jgi:asparagine synthase (glutamine-hydrolysing)
MCGIGGVALWNGETPNRAWMDGLLDAQKHRGPDGRGVWNGRGVILGHNRLAIIDLAMGQQPMATADGRHLIVYNGELYNFQDLRRTLEDEGTVFQTHSDTEVVLAGYARWGPGCLERFRGMYAFGIWDSLTDELFVARDRLGIKPLLYWQTATGFAFSSELQGLLQIPLISRDVNLGALDLYLHYQYIPAPYTIFSTVKKLEPGHWLLVSARDPTAVPKRYWSLRFAPDRSLSEGEWLEQLDHEVSDAVRTHLVSDVPFGAFLSGGIDSSIVATQMSRHLTHPLQTFTIGFDEAAYDERCYAADVARTIGAAHHEEVVRVDKYDLLDDLIFKLARHYGEPFADSSAIPTYCVSAVAGARVKMVLSGDGGDELFAGYNTYPNMLSAMTAPASTWGRVVSRVIGRDPDDLRARALGRPDASALEQHDIYYAYFANERRRTLYAGAVAGAVANLDKHRLMADLFAEAGNIECLSALQYLDIKTYLPGDILTKVDVAAMSHSLEVRVPLLDHKFVEWAARVPPELKLFSPTGGVCQKYLLKRYANTLLPGDAFARPKQGFGVPIDRWFSEELYGEVRSRLLSPVGILGRFFTLSGREELVATPAAALNHAPRIWALLCLQAWADVTSQ